MRNARWVAQAAMDKVKADKEREVKDGHDGTWIAHPALLPIAKQVPKRSAPNDRLLAVLYDCFGTMISFAIEHANGLVTIVLGC